MHFVRVSYRIDDWDERTIVAVLEAELTKMPWDDAVALAEPWELDAEPEEKFQFAEVPAELSSKKKFASWEKALKAHLYQRHTMSVWKCPKLKLYSEAGELEGDFRARLSQCAKEQRDLQVEKLRKRYGSKLATLQGRIRSAEQSVERESEQFRKASFDSAIKIGSTLMGALFGRKLMSRTNVSKASTSMRSMGSAAGQRGDITRAKEKLTAYQQQLKELEEEFESEIEELETEYDTDALALEQLELRPRKSDIEVKAHHVVWTPWQVDSGGMAKPLFEIQ